MNFSFLTYPPSIPLEKTLEEIFSIEKLSAITKKELYSSFHYPVGKYFLDHVSVYYLLDANGLFHHEDLPSLVILFNKDKCLSRVEIYYSHGVLYRENGPAYITLADCRDWRGVKMSSYQQNKLLPGKSLAGETLLSEIKHILEYNLDKIGLWSEIISPSCIKFPFVKLYNNSLYSAAGPSHLKINNETFTYHYTKNGIIHREDGPAVLIFDDEGEFLSSKWLLEGEELE